MSFILIELENEATHPEIGSDDRGKRSHDDGISRPREEWMKVSSALDARREEQTHMKLRKEVPLERIFQGTKHHPPMIEVKIWPRVRLMYCEHGRALAPSDSAESAELTLGNSEVRSLAAEIELAVMLAPIDPCTRRESASLISSSGRPEWLPPRRRDASPFELRDGRLGEGRC